MPVSGTGLCHRGVGGALCGERGSAMRRAPASALDARPRAGDV